MHWDRQLSETANADSGVCIKAVPCLSYGTGLEHLDSYSFWQVLISALQLIGAMLMRMLLTAHDTTCHALALDHCGNRRHVSYVIQTRL